LLLKPNVQENNSVVKFYQIAHSMVTEIQIIDSYYSEPVLDMSMSSNGMYLALSF